jgi:hypothetical protein
MTEESNPATSRRFVGRGEQFVASYSGLVDQDWLEPAGSKTENWLP